MAVLIVHIPCIFRQFVPLCGLFLYTSLIFYCGFGVSLCVCRLHLFVLDSHLTTLKVTVRLAFC